MNPNMFRPGGAGGVEPFARLRDRVAGVARGATVSCSRVPAGRTGTRLHAQRNSCTYTDRRPLPLRLHHAITGLGSRSRWQVPLGRPVRAAAPRRP